MATKPKAAAATTEAAANTEAPPAPPPAAPRAASAAPVTDFVSVWVHHFGTALAKNQTGFIFATRADADQMIADGDAILAGNLSFSGPNITRRPAAPPPPPPPPPPEEPPEGVNGDSEPEPEPEPDPRESATLDTLRAGAATWTGPGSVNPDTFWNNRNQTQVTLSNVQGNPAAAAALEGQTVTVTISHAGTRFNLQIDTTGLDLTGATVLATSVV